MRWPRSLHVTVWHWIWGGWGHNWEKTLPWDTEVTQSRAEPAWGSGSHSWLLHKLHIRSCPDPLQLTLYHTSPPIHTKRPHKQKLGAVIGCEGQRGLALEVACEQSKENKYKHLHRQCIGDSSNLCMRPTQAKRPHGPHLLQHSLPLGQGSQCRERGKHTPKGNRASLCPTLRYSTPATQGQSPPLIRQGWPLSIEEVLPHTQFQL